jgi:endonuclease/exonuclease/phosphatase family metal-dependent hydrolase
MCSEAYHSLTLGQPGHEKRPTLLQNYNPARPYHVDHAFAAEPLVEGSSMEIGLPKGWLAMSDHIPLVVDITLGAAPAL